MIAAKVDVECPEDDCDYSGEMPVVGDDGGYVELRCPSCGASAYERAGD